MKYIITIAIALSYLFGLSYYYDYQDKTFISNLKKSIETGESLYLEKYKTSTFKKDIYEKIRIKDHFIYNDLEYEWKTLKDSVENIKSVKVKDQKTDYINNVFYFTRIDCYYNLNNNNQFE